MKKLSFLLGIVVVLALAFVSLHSVSRGAADCPYGVTNDPYPGLCPIYTDQNDDSFCDHGEVEEIVYEEIEIADQTLREYFAMFYFEYLGIILAFTLLLFGLNKKHKKLTKSIFAVLMYVLLPLFAIVRALYIGYIKQSGGEVFEFGRIMGYASIRLLFLILYAKPFYILRKNPVKKFGIATKNYFGFIISQRRALGIAVFYLALGHALGYLAFRYTKDTTINSFFYPPAFITGIVAFVALFIGRITSNNISIRKFKKLRKPIQMTAYAALIASVVHIFFINQQAGLMLAGLTVFYFILKILERRKN